MPILIKRKLGPVTLEVPYYEELLMNEENGRLSRDLACHALWSYYGQALQSLRKAKNNFVYEDDPSLVFNVTIAQQILESVAKLYDVRIEDMVKYWPLVERQRIALGGDTNESLPPEFKFQFSMRN